MKLRTLTLLAVASLLLPSCFEPQSARTAGRITRDDAALFQTDSLAYTLRAGATGVDGEIGVTFTNRTGGTVYIVNCNGATVVSLEKRVTGQWKNVWSPPIPLCLGPPITVLASGTYRTRIRIYGGYPRTNSYPQFSVTDIRGEYRAVWLNVLTSYRDRPPFGNALPIDQRVSNRFKLATERR